MQRSRRWTEDDDGSASLEFITAGLLLLLPVVYLVLAVSVIQAGALAVEGAARQAARVFVQAPTQAEGEAAAERAIAFALADHGIDASSLQVAVQCSESPCLTRRGYVTITVGTTVTLPLLPPGLTADVPVGVPLEATATQQVSRFWGAR